MSDVKVITNYHWRDVVFGYELPAERRAEFDYLDDDEFTMHQFIVYRGEVYDLEEFMVIGRGRGPHFPSDHPMNDWDGYMPVNAFSAIVIRLDDRCERVQVGRILA